MNNLKVLLSTILFTVSFWGYAQEKPQIVWKEKVHDLHQVNPKNSSIETIFFFSVKGKTPVVINNVSVNCGCTTVDWIKYPIKPGEQGYVKVVFRTKGQSGYFDKSLL